MKRPAGRQKTILAIESSCDDTAAAILRGDPNAKLPKYKILCSVVNSQIALHRRTGGVVPEIAARAHVQNILPVTELALRQAKLKLEDIDHLAVTAGPGLIVSLLVGVEFIKGLALATGKPVIPINHMAGHLYSGFAGVNPKYEIRNPKIRFPVISLVVSGGHTMLIVMKDYLHYRVIGQTVDDAAGEAFDKVARLLGLPYPGGPGISRLAKTGRATINFPRPIIQENNYNFSFSGLKTAVRYYLENQESRIKNLELRTKKQGLKADIAKSFEEAVVDVLITKTLRAAKQYKAKTITLGGGVAANHALRSALATACRDNDLGLAIAEPKLCTDNAAMIAVAAYFQMRSKAAPVRAAEVKADPGWELATRYSKINRS